MEGRRTGHGHGGHRDPSPPHQFQQPPEVTQPLQPGAALPPHGVPETPPGSPPVPPMPGSDIQMPEIKSDTDMEFHFFRSHDLDHNNKVCVSCIPHLHSFVCTIIKLF